MSGGACTYQGSENFASISLLFTPLLLPLLLQIGPGEVDGELDREVGEECTKYGTVTG